MEGFNPTQTADEIFVALNQLRETPQEFNKHIQARLDTYEGKNFKVGNELYQSFDGKAAPEEAMACLENLAPKSTLIRVPALDLAAKDLADFLGESGEVSHMGKDTGKGKTRMGDRIKAHGKWAGKIGEVIGVQPTNGLNFVIQWVIDDGVKGRGDRNSILNKEFHKVGIACATHKIYKTVAVVVFAEMFAAEGEELREVKAKENPDLIKKLPDGLDKIPEDADSMTVKKKLALVEGAWTTTFVLTYKLKDGSERVVEKEYDGKK